ncbi:NACHT domain- and WD repeat-containing protein 1 isoform X1 [Ochotona curzoniae]|uniref:NACHT domain- and WD repeat-containing protein 1 isoform X1 n=1 Tax=Ochotona curzoniae TaxID=130825 RepID=UPI001B34FBFB|nr:NACHT domain- and WD repeat-containing protein 1 isoform X1 [Ochotona curzoniae]
MDAEREFLQRNAYPELQTFCQKLGLQFEVADLRWGLPSSQATVHLTPELCLEELERCQRTSVGPAYVALLGNQYGPRAVPLQMEEKEWDAVRSQLAASPRDMELLAQGFCKDENAIPPSYVLHVPGAGQPREPEDATLASALRSGAQEAWRLGLLTQGQWLRHERSVVEWELEQGLRGPGATVFVRDIHDLPKHLLDDCALPMADRLPDGCPDTAAQALLSSLKGRLTQEHPGILHTHRLPWSRDLGTPKSKVHGRYLKELSEQLVARTTQQVLQHLRELQPPPELLWLFQEIRHHHRQGTEATRIFCGRQGLLARLGEQLRRDDSRSHPPLVLCGPPGVGKTALMCKLAQEMASLLRPHTVTVLRLLGTSLRSRDPRGLLESLCLQVCLAFGLPPPPAQVLATHARSGPFFHALLHTISSRHFESLVLLLDSVDDLESVRGARLPGLPLQCPPGVHLILSACSGQGGFLETLQETLRDPAAYWEVQPLSGDQGLELLRLLLADAGRMLRPEQRDLVRASCLEGGHPGHLRLAFEEARTWASFTMPAPLAATPEEATHQFCARLEQTHGQLLVAHVLGYLVSSRYGLSEAELKDVLSLDDELLQAVYQDWTLPSQELLRFPPLLWVRLRRDLGCCLARRPGDGCTLLAIAPRQLAQVIRQRYLSGPERAKRHSVLADFFSGTWSQGTKKLITLPLVGKPLNLDRKVAPQPLWFSDTVANLRKLSELPWHLLHAGRLEELRQEVLGNLSWIFCRAISGGIDCLLDDFALCAPVLDSAEADLVREALQLCRPTIELRGMERSILYTELLGRLQFFAASHPALVGRLCEQAQSWLRACPHPVLVPLAGFLPPPGGPLRATLTGCHQGITAMTWSEEEKLLVVGTQDGIVVVWDVQEEQLVHFLTGHSGAVRCLRVFAGGTRALSASSDRSLRLWDLRSGRREFCLTMDAEGSLPCDPGPRSWSLHVDEASGIVYAAMGSKISAWKLPSAELTFCVAGDAADPWLCTALLAGQAGLLAVSRGGVVRLWHSATGSPQGEQRMSGVGADGVPTCAVSGQRQGLVVIGFSDGSVSLVSIKGDRLLEKVPEAVGCLALSKDESLLAAGFGSCVRLLLADTQAFQRFGAADLQHEAAVESAVFGPENNLLVTASRDARIQAATFTVWDLGRVPRAGASATFLDRTGLTAVSHQGAYLYYPRVGDKRKVTVWDVAAGEERDVLDASSEVRCVEVAEQTQLLLAGLASGVVLLVPLTSRQDVVCVPPPEARRAVTCLSLDKRETRLAVAYDNLVQVLDIGPGDPCPVVEGPTYTFYTQLPESITCLAVLGDCRVLYGMSRGEIFLYQCTGARVCALEAHGGRVTCLHVSHGEQLAVSGAEDALLCLWDLQAGRCTAEMGYMVRACCCDVLTACFSQNDKYVYAGLKDGSVIVCSTLDGSLLTVQFAHAPVNRIVPTRDGFIAPTRSGYVLRECFQPSASSPSLQPDPLRSFKKAVWVVRATQRGALARAAQTPGDSASRSARGHGARSNRRSQVCVLV